LIMAFTLNNCSLTASHCRLKRFKMPPRLVGKKKPLLTFYGDDFTGSTDVLEALATSGIPAVLFLSPPSQKALARFPGVRAIGIAGTSRSNAPKWMDKNLPGIFEKLKALGAPICHYKTCSTFDSSPEIGNIGRAAEIGKRIFGRAVPVVAGVTKLNRFVVFSNLFAAGSISGKQDIFRIDRHPTMSRHPSTPMNEADLRRHLARQTRRNIAGFDFLQMQASDVRKTWRKTTDENDIVVLDTFDDATARIAGQLLTEYAKRNPAFVVGSSGVEYALIEHWRAEGRLPPVPPPKPCGRADKLIAICGSCSPVTERQIAWAESHRFATLAVDTAALIARPDRALAELVCAAAAALSRNAGVVLHTARGPDDPRIAAAHKALKRRGLGAHESARIIGGALGQALRGMLSTTRCRRVVLAGGDSSSHAVSNMGIEALTFSCPLTPGAPLCRIHSRDGSTDGVEILLKGGQVGKVNFFAQALAGH
jgi:3-oxoisoapionate kinase